MDHQKFLPLCIILGIISIVLFLFGFSAPYWVMYEDEEGFGFIKGLWILCGYLEDRSLCTPRSFLNGAVMVVITNFSGAR